MTESVLPVDEQDVEVGEGDKLEAHRQGLLHRGFSEFALDDGGAVLLQRRALGKYHPGGPWSNACCSHPESGEVLEMAAGRRFVQEMGVECKSIEPTRVLRYQAVVGDRVENELDYLSTARAIGPPRPSPGEVCAWRFVDADEVDRRLGLRPHKFTAWYGPAWRIVAGRLAGERGIPQETAE